MKSDLNQVSCNNTQHTIEKERILVNVNFYIFKINKITSEAIIKTQQNKIQQSVQKQHLVTEFTGHPLQQQQKHQL